MITNDQCRPPEIADYAPDQWHACHRNKRFRYGISGLPKTGAYAGGNDAASYGFALRHANKALTSSIP
jgi:hypothetical protein